VVGGSVVVGAVVVGAVVVGAVVVVRAAVVVVVGAEVLVAGSSTAGRFGTVVTALLGLTMAPIPASTKQSPNREATTIPMIHKVRWFLVVGAPSGEGGGGR
jgi:hypothetical protein